MQGTSSLPAFMSFNSITNNLTVTPGVADFGLYTLQITYTSDYDGMNPSLKANSHVLTIYRTEIGSGTILNQTYLMGSPLTLALPSVVTNPSGTVITITWAASPLPVWLSLSS